MIGRAQQPIAELDIVTLSLRVPAQDVKDVKDVKSSDSSHLVEEKIALGLKIVLPLGKGQKIPLMK